jgi:hypothetical protein
MPTLLSRNEFAPASGRARNFFHRNGLSVTRLSAQLSHDRADDYGREQNEGANDEEVSQVFFCRAFFPRLFRG